MSSNKYYDTFDQYYEKFGDVFPSTEYGLPDKEAIDFMEECLRAGKKAQEIRPLRKDVQY
jgi:hypothetical protein